MKIIKKLNIQMEFLRFIAVGVMNTLHYYVLYLVLLELTGIYYLVSHWIATLGSMFISYFLNVYFTYQVKPSWKSFLTFPMTQVVNVIVQSACLGILVEWAGISSVIAPFFAVIFTVPITFIVTRRILN